VTFGIVSFFVLSSTEHLKVCLLEQILVRGFNVSIFRFVSMTPFPFTTLNTVLAHTMPTTSFVRADLPRIQSDLVFIGFRDITMVP